MKKIAYIELDTHAEIVKDFSNYIKNSENIRCDFYLSKKIIDIVCDIDNMYLTSPKTIVDDLDNIDYDEIIIGTAHRYFNIFNKLVKKYKTSIIIHNINFSKATKWQLFKNVFKNEQKYRLKLLLKEGLLTAPKLYKNSKLYVLDEALSDEVYQYLDIFKNMYISDNECVYPIKIVVPGTISQKRRDYKYIIQKIQKWKIDAEVIFCGKASGEELQWLREVEEELHQNISIQYFTYKLNAKVFDKLMKSAHLFWCPICEKTDFMSIPEIYRKTKMSGNVGDAIKYGKMSIFPKNYPSKCKFIIKEQDDIENQIMEIFIQLQKNEPYFTNL